MSNNKDNQDRQDMEERNTRQLNYRNPGCFKDDVQESNRRMDEDRRNSKPKKKSIFRRNFEENGGLYFIVCLNHG